MPLAQGRFQRASSGENVREWRGGGRPAQTECRRAATIAGKGDAMSFALRPERWLRSVRHTLSRSPARRERRASLRVIRLEDRVNPVNVTNPLVNTPEPATMTSNFTQSETSTLSFGTTVLPSYNDSHANLAANRFTGYGPST